MSYETRDELRDQNTLLRKEIKNLRIENERLRRIGLLGRIIDRLRIKKKI